MNHICLAIEDALSEAVAEKLLSTSRQPFQITQRLGNSGFGYLKRNLSKFNQLAAKVTPVLLLTDLDKANCVLDFIQSWQQGLSLSEDLLFRVVVREIEAWLLADRQAFANWLDIPITLVPNEPENLSDPKQHLLNLVRRSKKRNLKAEILPSSKSHSPVGLGYNTELIRYVNNHWDPLTAAECAPSLARAQKRIHELVTRHMESP
ncbi:MAG: DUF4276 family protein [Gammaproteobacteria bacterium]|nr:DUF4276 family protein [Gammaproteobacteria bacterium]MBU1724192.1 DUF4276 family protein [Gammaproteobacteria bacterium]MBU2005063.1 DUF4276 family protein [Gammaproteobacteria bacterium]